MKYWAWAYVTDKALRMLVEMMCIISDPTSQVSREIFSSFSFFSDHTWGAVILGKH